MYHQVLADFLRFAWKFQGNAVCAASTVSAGNDNSYSYKLPPLIAAFNRTVLSAHCVSTIGRCTAISIVHAIVHVDVSSSWWIDSPDGGAITFTIDAYESDSVIIMSEILVIVYRRHGQKGLVIRVSATMRGRSEKEFSFILQEEW